MPSANRALNTQTTHSHRPDTPSGTEWWREFFEEMPAQGTTEHQAGPLGPPESSRFQSLVNGRGPFPLRRHESCRTESKPRCIIT